MPDYPVPYPDWHDEARPSGVRTKVRESSGPTVLETGAIADGEYLKRDAGTIVGGTPAGGDGLGDVVGPASAIDEHLAVFDGVTGKLIKDGGAVSIVPVKASGAELDTGTDDAKFATAKALVDSAYAKTTDITATAVGLANADNTSDANKPVSSATQTALDLKANDADVVHDTGDEAVAGVKTFSSGVAFPGGAVVDSAGRMRSDNFRGVGDGFNIRAADDSQAVQIFNTSNLRLYKNVTFDVDNTTDIGASGATRPRSIYIGTGIAIEATITAPATTGAQTIDKTAGSVNFAAGAGSLVVTNNKVTADSIIIATVATNDGTLKSVQAVAGAGSFTLFGNATATAETRVNFWVLTPD